MDNKILRDRLSELGKYLDEFEFPTTFLKKSAIIEMDTLLVGLEIGEELSIDMSLNYFTIPELTEVLQFYGQLVLNELMADPDSAVTEENILMLVNEMNRLMPIGQLIYMGEKPEEKTLGIRYLLPTDLSSEESLQQCVKVLMLLMQVYEFLASALTLMADGSSVEESLETLKQLLGAV